MPVGFHEGTSETAQAASLSQAIDQSVEPKGDAADDVAAAAEVVLATASPCKAYLPTEGVRSDPQSEANCVEGDEADRGASAPDRKRRNTMVDMDRVAGTVNAFAATAQRSVRDAVIWSGNSVEGRLRAAEGPVEQLYGQAKDAVRQGVDYIADVERESYGDPAFYARQGGGAARQHGKANPLLAVLIACAAGYLLSYLVHGKH